MRRLAPLAAVLVGLSCKAGERAASTPADNAVAGGTVVISTGGDPDVLLPPLIATFNGHQISELIYDHLADLGNDLNTVGDGGFKAHLAKSWTWSPDSLSIAFSLDPHARWHDGVPAHASDVAFTYALYRDSATASPSAPLISAIDSVTGAETVPMPSPKTTAIDKSTSQTFELTQARNSLTPPRHSPKRAQASRIARNEMAWKRVPE